MLDGGHPGPPYIGLSGMTLESTGSIRITSLMRSNNIASKAHGVEKDGDMIY
jgi:hypothetical protein